MSTRRRAREIAVQACYAFEFSGNTPRNVIDTSILNLDEPAVVTDFAVALFEKTVSHKEEFDKLIMARATNWDFNRIAVLDKIVLRLIICEFLNFTDIPPKVSIDEGIEIAKKFSTEQSGRFVNGIADAILVDLKEKGILKKSGRGLN
ncbi:MAG: transcription antitermination factor NusB [Calditrichaeota bacterium]|nr:MAG: transcription antitermination factor NusB [Calditrichota bacterium]